MAYWAVLKQSVNLFKNQLVLIKMQKLNCILYSMEVLCLKKIKFVYTIASDVL